MVIINYNGFWEDSSREDLAHCHDKSLSSSLVEFFKRENINSVVDFGCGLGDYVKSLRESNINACGYDGNPNTPELTDNICKVLDLSKSVQLTPYDWVMSLEVGEHLPKEFEDIFIYNLHNNNKYGILLSWAIKYQGGTGHVNEQNNDYIKSKICKMGYTNDIEAEKYLRANCDCGWFTNTIMVFRKV